MEETPKKTLNEKFTDIADVVSETMGRWWVAAASFIAVVIWLLSGPFFHFSDTWQLIINTPTTILEMWIGFLIAAAANRVEKHNRALQEHQEVLLEKIEKIEEQHERMLLRLTENGAQNLVLLQKMTAVHETTVLKEKKR